MLFTLKSDRKLCLKRLCGQLTRKKMSNNNTSVLLLPDCGLDTFFCYTFSACKNSDASFRMCDEKQNKLKFYRFLKKFRVFHQMDVCKCRAVNFSKNVRVRWGRDGMGGGGVVQLGVKGWVVVEGSFICSCILLAASYTR